MYIQTEPLIENTICEVRIENDTIVSYKMRISRAF